MFTDWFKNIPPEISTAIIAMLPIAELRGALPIALEVYHFPFWKAFLLAVLGNMIPALGLIWFLPPVSRFLSAHISFFKKFFDWFFTRTHKKFGKDYQRFGEVALMVFVAIPLPATGAWTGAAAAFLFGIPKKRALIFIFLGVCISGFIVAMLTKGVSFLVT